MSATRGPSGAAKGPPASAESAGSLPTGAAGLTVREVGEEGAKVYGTGRYPGLYGRFPTKFAERTVPEFDKLFSPSKHRSSSTAQAPLVLDLSRPKLGFDIDMCGFPSAMLFGKHSPFLFSAVVLPPLKALSLDGLEETSGNTLKRLVAPGFDRSNVRWNSGLWKNQKWRRNFERWDGLDCVLGCRRLLKVAVPCRSLHWLHEDLGNFWPNLQVLIVSQCELDWLPESLALCTKLKALDFSGNPMIGGTKPDHGATVLVRSAFPQLESLAFDNCGLACQPLTEVIRNVLYGSPQLAHLSFEGNDCVTGVHSANPQMAPAVVDALNEALRWHAALQKLNFYDGDMVGGNITKDRDLKRMLQRNKAGEAPTEARPEDLPGGGDGGDSAAGTSSGQASHGDFSGGAGAARKGEAGLRRYAGIRTGHLLDHHPDNLLAKGGRKYGLRGAYCFGTPGVCVADVTDQYGGRDDLTAFYDALKQAMPQKKFAVVELGVGSAVYPQGFAEASSLGGLRALMSGDFGLPDSAFGELTGLDIRAPSGGGSAAGAQAKKGAGKKKGGKRR